MCMLCGETREQGKREAIYLAEQLERMAGMERALAAGRIDPHGKDNFSGDLARSIVRMLVEQYV